MYHSRLAAIDAGLVGMFTRGLRGFIPIQARVPSSRRAETRHKRIYRYVVTAIVTVIAVLYANSLGACGLR